MKKRSLVKIRFPAFLYFQQVMQVLAPLNSVTNMFNTYLVTHKKNY